MDSALDYSLKLDDQIEAALKAALDDALDYALDYSLKLDDGREAALKASLLEPEPLIDKFAAALKAVTPDAPWDNDEL